GGGAGWGCEGGREGGGGGAGIATLLAMVGVGWLLPSPLAGQGPAIVTVLGLVALVLAAGLAGVLWRWRQAVQALHLAEQEIQRAQDQARRAEQRWAEAEARHREEG